MANNRYSVNQIAKQGYLKIGNNINLSNEIDQLIVEEKYSPYEAVGKANLKYESKSVVELIKRIQNRYTTSFNKRFKSITSDNGAEFKDAKSIEELGTKYFYYHSYSSYERGRN